MRPRSASSSGRSIYGGSGIWPMLFNIQHRAFIIKFDFKQCAVARGHCCVNTFVIAQQQFCARFWRFRGANMRKNAFCRRASVQPALQSCRRSLYRRTGTPDGAGCLNQKIAGGPGVKSVKVPCVSAPIAITATVNDSYCVQAWDSGQSGIRAIQRRNR